LVHDFDHVGGPGVTRDPFAVYRNAPNKRAFFSPMNGGYWVLTKAEDIRAALQQPDLFSSASTGIPAQPQRKEKLFPLELDPPEHRPYRQVLAPFFAPKVVAAKAAVIGEVCIGLLDGLVGRGECEFVADFAQPFPTPIFTAMLGLPDSESKQFVEWNSVLLHGYDDPARRAAAGVEINEYLRSLIDERAGDPRDDLVSNLLATTIEDRPVSRDEVQNFTFLLFIAGLDTVTAALSFAFRFLAENPGHRRQLVDNPELITGAVEELLRVFSFVNTARTAVRNVEFAGVPMKAGDRVRVSTPLHSRGPADFPLPSPASGASTPKASTPTAADRWGWTALSCAGTPISRALTPRTAIER